jgi:hypothetical protein
MTAGAGYPMSELIPHRISEAQSDMRGVKEGWYMMDEEGNLTFGPFSSRDGCLHARRTGSRSID